MNVVAEPAAFHRANLERLLARQSRPAPSWLQSLRERAFGRFESLGWPTAKHEDWRFTSVKPIARQTFNLAGDADGGVAEAHLQPYSLGGEAAARLVFVNGAFREDLSRLDQLPTGVRATPLSHALSAEGETLEAHLARYANSRDEAFTALNTAFIEEGAFLRVDDGVKLAAPIHLVFVAGEGDAPFIVQPRNLFLVGAGAEITLVESHFATTGQLYLNNGVTEMVLGDGARAAHYFKEDHGPSAFHVSTVQARLGRDSRFESHNLLFGGALIRNNIRVAFGEPGGDALVTGLSIGQDGQLLDNDVFIDHARPDCASEQYFKGILDDYAHAVFTGRVVVRPDAQKTDARQTNRNLLLSETARVDAKPQLEIYADDVKCAHGATTGHLDEDAFFYLKSRGLDPKTARDLLLYAFAHEVIERMPLEPFRKLAETFLYQRFAKARLIEEGSSL